MRSAFGSSALRMMRITLSIDSSAICRPSRMWMRRSTSPRRCCVRRVTVSKRNAIHSSIACFRFFERGRPSRPSITRLTGSVVSRRVLASRRSMNSCGSWRLLRGSNTRRTGERLVRLVAHRVERAANSALRLTWSCDSDFLPSLGFGLVARSMSSSTTRAETPNGSSVTATRHWPRASSSTVQRARTRRLPRPDS